MRRLPHDLRSSFKVHPLTADPAHQAGQINRLGRIQLYEWTQPKWFLRLFIDLLRQILYRMRGVPLPCLAAKRRIATSRGHQQCTSIFRASSALKRSLSTGSRVRKFASSIACGHFGASAHSSRIAASLNPPETVAASTLLPSSPSNNVSFTLSF